MKRFLLLAVTLGVVIAAVGFSQNCQNYLEDLRVEKGQRNPWTHLRINNHPGDFHFVIVSDRTGGHRPRIFSQAVKQINLLQPAFVVSVGDLIEGYTKDRKRMSKQWLEFQRYVSDLKMPFFYVPGNHDISNPSMDKEWKQRFGRPYYHFVFRDVLFLALHTDDPPGSSKISKKQVEYFQKVLKDNDQARWTVVLMHKPLWHYANPDKNGWPEIEKLLRGRKYTVFAGHLHRYKKFTRGGMNYYQLATTGGSSRMRGTRYGEFDHIVWVSMKKNGPVLANVMLDGIYTEDVKQPITAEPGYSHGKRKRVYPVRGRVFFEGCPTPNAQVAFYLEDKDKKRLSRTGDALVDADGSFRLTTYTPNDGTLAGKYKVSVVWRQPLSDGSGGYGPNLLPERYGDPKTSGLTANVTTGENEFTFDLVR